LSLLTHPLVFPTRYDFNTQNEMFNILKSSPNYLYMVFVVWSNGQGKI